MSIISKGRRVVEDVGRIFDIQKFSLHDGPGIRTVVFLKGCPMACAWCSNPGSRKLQVLEVADGVHPHMYVSDSRDYPVDEVVRTCLQDLSFYEESGGGVTLSGGEAMVQHRFSSRLLGELQLLPFHQFGERKYELLGWDYRMVDVPPLHEEDLGEYVQTFHEHGVRA